MARELQSHQTDTQMIQSAPPKVDAGADMALKAEVWCPEACDLRGNIVRIVVQDGALAKEVELSEFDGTVNQTDEFLVKAPTEPGDCTWTAVFPAQEREGVLHGESSTPLSFTVKAHATSIAVWDVPYPIAFSDKFKIKVGVKCSGECTLAGKEIVVYDQEGEEVATGELGGLPWPGTSALYWAEVELEAPGVEGYYRWRVEFRKPDLELPHDQASYKFGFATARAPQHMVTVEVIDRDTKAPIKGADVLLHPYRGRSDEGGVAKIGVLKGEYKIYVWKGNSATFRTTVDVADDVTIKAELFPAPPQVNGFPS